MNVSDRKWCKKQIMIQARNGNQKEKRDLYQSINVIHIWSIYFHPARDHNLPYLSYLIGNALSLVIIFPTNYNLNWLYLNCKYSIHHPSIKLNQ